jgi:acetyl esterase/lipase
MGGVFGRAIVINSGDDENVIPPQYYWWWHPHRTWTDSVMNLLVYFVFPLKRRFVPPRDPSKLKKAQVQFAKEIRSTFDELLLKGVQDEKNGAFFKWSAKAGCDIVEVTIEIDRADTLFQEWNLVDRHFIAAGAGTKITLFVSFPETLLPEGVAKPTNKTSYGCLVLEEKDVINLLLRSIPLVVWIHGGGLTVGNPNMAEGLEMINDSDNNKEFVFVRVKYGLAPENTFPVAPLQVCSVICHFLSKDYTNVHICGVSAGAYLAAVSGLETYRNHKKKSSIRSIFAACPMATPAADSLSMYQNSASSFTDPVHWLRWSYQVYFDLSDAPNDTTSLTPRDAALVQGSNRAAWNESKWKGTKLRRLAEPAIDVPKCLLEAKLLRIIITTNKADPLHDEGLALVRSVQKVGADISHHDHRGSHWLGTKLDKQCYKTLVDDFTGWIFKDT